MTDNIFFLPGETALECVADAASQHLRKGVQCQLIVVAYPSKAVTWDCRRPLASSICVAAGRELARLPGTVLSTSSSAL